MPTIEPLKIFEHAGRYRLVLEEDDMLELIAPFNEQDRASDGHNWEAVARQALRMYAQEHIGYVDFYPEIDIFIAEADDREPLEDLGALLAQAIAEHDFLEELIRDAEDDWFDD